MPTQYSLRRPSAASKDVFRNSIVKSDLNDSCFVPEIRENQAAQGSLLATQPFRDDFLACLLHVQCPTHVGPLK